MIENKAQLLADLAYVGSKVQAKTNVYVFAGAAYMWHGLKDATKDIDICCSYEEADRIVSALRMFGNMESVTGINDVHFLRIIFKSFGVQIFIKGIWMGDEYEFLEAAHCDSLTFGGITFLIPDVKTLVMIRDRQIQALYSDWKKLKGERSI
ncbi:MAG: hypothetical protein JW999_10280 [Methanotrichaceae archaeon]|nr:hypothetical protein [Methanotrichaceae archaeon]